MLVDGAHGRIIQLSSKNNFFTGQHHMLHRMVIVYFRFINFHCMYLFNLSPSLSVPLSVSLALSLSVCLSVSLTVSLSVSMSLHLCLSVLASLSASLSLSPSASLPPTPPPNQTPFPLFCVPVSWAIRPCLETMHALGCFRGATQGGGCFVCWCYLFICYVLVIIGFVCLCLALGLWSCVFPFDWELFGVC